MNIRIYALKRDFDVQKAERYFKERRIPYQFVDLNKTVMGKRELESVCRQACSEHEKTHGRTHARVLRQLC